MLKRMTIKRILVTSSALMALFLIYLVPNENNNHLKNITQKLEYVNLSGEQGELFLLGKNNHLTRTTVVFSSKLSDTEGRVAEIVDYLTQESKSESKIPSGFKTYLPVGTKLNSVKLENNLLKVDFNDRLFDIDEKMEEKMIEGIIYSLTAIPDVKKVILYVDGTIITKLPKTQIHLPSTLDRTIGINKEYHISSYKNINKVTVYYLESFNEDYYYVPVTKYVNDDRDKIRIIIDELSGASSYNTNLMSFLNSNVELMSYNQSDDVLNLVFNSYIFDDTDEKSILEEVIYTICLSVADNYDVKEVSFSVGNEEIYKSVLKSLE